MSAQLISKSEASLVAGLDATVVDRAIDRLRIGRPFVQRRKRTRLLTPKRAFLIAADHLIARDIAAPAQRTPRTGTCWKRSKTKTERWSPTTSKNSANVTRGRPSCT